MIKILTYINSGLLVAAIGFSGYVYSQRTRFVNDMLSNIQNQIIKNIQYDLKMQMPSTTGPALPFGK
tara:strand:+ start:3143 stop:3343 length:201 start_codon:yes stop_codon:yes gene_type:complete